jgi:hypothetical protein
MKHQPTTVELLEPRFLGIVELTAEQSSTVRAGQLGVASFRPFEESIARYAWSVSTRISVARVLATTATQPRFRPTTGAIL